MKIEFPLPIKHKKSPSYSKREGRLPLVDTSKMSEEEKLELVKSHPANILNIDNPTMALIQFAIKNLDPSGISIKCKSDERGVLAVVHLNEKNSEEVKLASVKQDGDSIRYIKNPSPAVKAAARISMEKHK